MTAEELRTASKNVPVILIGHTPSVLLKDFDVISTDEEDAAFQIIEHLAELGHKRIAYISGGTDEGPARRTKAFLSEMNKRNLSSSASIFEGAWSQEAGYSRTADILKLKTLPTAIYAANDHIALGVLAKLREEGISVPGDMSVVGYDDSDFARLRIADLTSMKESLFNMGRTGFELLISRIDNKGKTHKPKHLKIKPELIVRGSTGPRRKNLK
jgi:DNA-binding LacI/PurR family transcriptional regulator